MAQLFPRSANTMARLSIFGGLFTVLLLFGLGFMLTRSPVATREGDQRVQPVQFSHKHHVGDIGIDCRYCHTSVEDSASAGIPPTSTCMNCHSQLFTNSVELEKVVNSWETGEPLEWVRVHDLADYVYFNHSIHVRNGIGCESCHGRVDEMPLMMKAEPLTMEWCLECHRNPENFVRPLEEVYSFGYPPPIDQSVLGPQLVESYNIRGNLDDCAVCHR